MWILLFVAEFLSLVCQTLCVLPEFSPNDTGPDVIYVYIDNVSVPSLLRRELQLEPDIYVLEKDVALIHACKHTDRLVIIRMDDNLSNEDLPIECDDESAIIFHIIPESSPNTRNKRQAHTTTSSMNLYNIIAQVSGGSVYVTNKKDIGAVVDLIKETISAKPPVSIMKFLLKTSDSNTFTTPVDELIANLTIKIQSTLAISPTFNLYRPNGTRETFRDPAVATKQTLGSRLVVVKLTKPAAGLWKFTRTSTREYEVEISAKTDLDFTYKFMQPGPGGFGEYPLTGRPIAGENTSVQVSVPLYDKVRSVDSMVILDQRGKTKTKEVLHNIGGRRGKSMFKTYITIPASEFKIAIEGRDKSNNLFRRLDPRLISTLAVKLEVLKVSGTLYIKSSVTLTYRVTNVGGGTTKVVVKISDDKGFAQSPTTRHHTLASHVNITGTFVIKAGARKGETVTITVSANADGAPANKVQYSVQRLTVEENVTKAVDNIAPTCNVTRVSGKCDIGTDLCACVNKTWQMEANVGDVGFGLQSVFASGAGNRSKIHTDTFGTGHTIDKGVITTFLQTDCCHQNAAITAVDLAGNVGLCNVTITPHFVPPDPKLCGKVNNLNSTKANNILCQTTSVSRTCDFENITCGGGPCSHGVLCKNKTWIMRAVISNHSYAISQAVPVNAGPSASLTRINDSLEMSMDCCHADVHINLIDIAGNIGRCYANTTVLYPSTTSGNISKSTNGSNILCQTTSVSRTCDFENITCGGGPCSHGVLCKNKTWIMRAVISNHSYAISQAVPVNAGPSASLTRINDSLEMSMDCCHADVHINLIDIAGNIGRCYANTTVLYPSTTSGNISKSTNGSYILCQTTSVSRTCDFENITCGGGPCSHGVLCKNKTWIMRAVISNHSYAISQAVPVNAGPSASLTRINDSLEMSMDCCHTDVYINLIDIAGNVGRCHANTTVLYPSTTASNMGEVSSTSNVPLIAGAVAGGVVLIGGVVVIAIIVKKHMVNKVEDST